MRYFTTPSRIAELPEFTWCYNYEDGEFILVLPDVAQTDNLLLQKLDSFFKNAFKENYLNLNLYSWDYDCKAFIVADKAFEKLYPEAYKANIYADIIVFANNPDWNQNNVHFLSFSGKPMAWLVSDDEDEAVLVACGKLKLYKDNVIQTKNIEDISEEQIKRYNTQAKSLIGQSNLIESVTIKDVNQDPNYSCKPWPMPEPPDKLTIKIKNLPLFKEKNKFACINALNNPNNPYYYDITQIEKLNLGAGFQYNKKKKVKKNNYPQALQAYNNAGFFQSQRGQQNTSLHAPGLDFQLEAAITLSQLHHSRREPGMRPENAITTNASVHAANPSANPNTNNRQPERATARGPLAISSILMQNLAPEQLCRFYEFIISDSIVALKIPDQNMHENLLDKFTDFIENSLQISKSNDKVKFKTVLDCLINYHRQIKQQIALNTVSSNSVENPDTSQAPYNLRPT